MNGLEAAYKLRKVSPGIPFASKPAIEIIKSHYRTPVFELFKDYSRPLRLLTMPGLRWELERALYAYRRKRKLSSEFYGIERDAWVYRASLAWIVGGKAAVLDKRAVANGAAIYIYSRVENYIVGSHEQFTGAWLDFNGHLSGRRLRAIRLLWPRVSHALVVTFKHNRHPTEVSSIAQRGWTAMFSRVLGVPRGEVSEAQYKNGPHNDMVQVTVVRRNGP